MSSAPHQVIIHRYHAQPGAVAARDHFFVVPGTYRWDRKTQTSALEIRNATGTVVRVRFPLLLAGTQAGDPPQDLVQDLNPGQDFALDYSQVKQFPSNTELEYSVYVVAEKRFAEGNSAPKIILDP